MQYLLNNNLVPWSIAGVTLIVYVAVALCFVVEGWQDTIRSPR